MKKIAKKSVTMASTSNFGRKSGKSLGSSMKRPGTAKVKKPFADILNANKSN